LRAARGQDAGGNEQHAQQSQLAAQREFERLVEQKKTARG
jgi:hypothetical protein